MTADNYEGARETIFNKYGNIALAEDQHVDNFNAACGRRDLQNHDKFVNFVSVITQNIDQLVTLGNTYEGMSVFASRAIIKALPFVYQRRFGDAFDLSTSRECRLNVLCEFLKTEQNKLEQLSCASRNFSQNSELRQFQQSKNTYQSHHPNHRSPMKKFDNKKYNYAGPAETINNELAFAAGASQVDHSCIFCSMDHASIKCKKQMSVEERRKCIYTHKC